MTETVTPAASPDQPDHFAEIAAGLHAVADRLAKLVGSGMPKFSYIQLNIQPGKPGDDDLTQRAVDAVTSALLDHPGVVEEMSGDTWHYSNSDAYAEPVGPIKVRIFQRVSNSWALKRDQKAQLAKREVEIERLRAEVTALRAAAALQPDADPTGLDYTRADTDADDPTPVSPARVPLHAGGVVDGGQLVDESDGEAVSDIPSPGCGHAACQPAHVEPDPWYVADEDLRETVHYRTGYLLDLNIACGAQSGPFTKHLDKVTCRACLAKASS